MKGFIGVDWGGTSLKIGLLDSKFSLKLKRTIPTKEIARKEDFLSVFPKAIFSLIKEAGINNEDIKGLGIGAPGVIDVRKGYIYLLPNVKGWENVPLKRLLEKRLPFNVYIDNDANLYALAESKLGAGKNFNNLLCLTLGTGVGGGLILNKKLHRAQNLSNCEAGHICVELEGRTCSCGAKGCIETFVGNKYLVNFYLENTQNRFTPIVRRLMKSEKELTPQILYKAALLGDKLSQRVFGRLANALGVYIAGIVNLLGLEAVIIGGGVVGAWRLISEDIKKIVKKYTMPPFNRKVKVLKAKLRKNAGILGAGILAKEGMGV